IEVQVLDPEGRPADATVLLDDRSSPLRRAAAGEYVADRIAPGPHDVTAQLKPFPKASGHVDVGEGERGEVALRVVEGETIEGVVVDANGAPVPNATVIVGADASPEPVMVGWNAAHAVRGAESWTRTAADGTFRLEHLAAGDYALSASGERF